ncbi:MAG TPA: FG-GAP repeat protein, partial [Planctomycetota bacterium]|nr:FG-GAP repeat protein [Planctomycetota bacterium]
MERIAVQFLVLSGIAASVAAAQGDCATTKATFSEAVSDAPPYGWIQVNLPGVPGCATDNRVGYGGMSFRSGLGWRVQALRFDADDSIDLAVTAYNQEAVYVLYGPWSRASNPPYSAWQVITADCGAQPVSTCPEVPIGECTHTPTETEYGLALSAGDVDGDGRDELFVSQPSYVGGTPAWVSRVYVYKWFDPQDVGPCVDPSMLFGFLEESSPSQKGFGREIAVGEFDGAAGIDLAVAVPFHPMARAGGCNECNPGAQIDQRGRVRIYSDVAAHLSGEESCTGGGGATLTLENPQQPEQGSRNGSFGVKMTASDVNGDGVSDLFVNAPGNGGSCTSEEFGTSWSAGQVLFFKG